MAEPYQWESVTPMPTARQRADPDWERKQRNREYRVAARREKRNRKADEKKQRKLNATILRRMTRNSDKYTKNAGRNKSRAIESERRSIWTEAIRQAERLAAKHDPSGRTFNVGPVTTMEDGTVISQEVLERREKKRKEKEEKAIEEVDPNEHEARQLAARLEKLPQDIPIPKDVDPDRFKLVAAQHSHISRSNDGLSKTQAKKLEKYAPKPIPPKPVLPDGIDVPEGEVDWIALWDLSDSELERRVAREKRRKQMERKNLRRAQQSGKRERRAARDEKRKVYRDLKETWKLIKAREKKHKLRLRAHEDREAKTLGVEVNTFERQQAMAICAKLGFTLGTTEGVEDIKPVVRGVKGKNIDWENLDIGDGNDIRPKDQKEKSQTNSRRVNLSEAASENQLEYIGGGAINLDDIQFSGENDDEDNDDEDNDDEDNDDEDNDDEEDDLVANKDEIRLDVGGDAHESVNYNHRMRRKVRRALENQKIQREILVRERAIKHLEQHGNPVPDALRTNPRPVHEKGKRILENGTIETDKQERVRARIELTEFNKAAKVLRRQAKEIALEDGLRIHAEMTGRIPKSIEPKKEAWEVGYGVGWHVPSPPRPEDMLKPEDLGRGRTKAEDGDKMEVDGESDSEEGFMLHGVKF